MIQIANYPCTGALYKESRKLLIKVQFLILYGPFKICKENRSESNYFFDNSLQMQNNLWGIKNLEKFVIRARKMVFHKKILLKCLQIIF